MKKFGWAIIGCGGIARTVAAEIVGNGSGKIVAAWNRTKEKAVEFCEIYGGKPCDSAEEAIRCKGVDGVYVATTHDKHAAYTELCIRNGVPVVCEKPFTINTEEAEKIFALAEKENVYVSEAMWTWHNKTARTVREWIQNGRLGEIKRVYAAYSWPMIRGEKYNKRLTEPALAGGALLDIGVYPIRYAYEIFGMPERVECRGNVVGGVDHSETVRLDYGTFQAEIVVSICGEDGEKFVVEGEDGRVEVPLFHMGREAVLTGKQNEKFVDDEPFLYGVQMRQAAEEIASGRKESAFCTKRATLDEMRLLDECRRQMGVRYPTERSI